MDKQKKRFARRRTDQILAGILAAVCLFLIFLPLLSKKLHPILYVRSEQPVLEVSDLYVSQGEVDENLHTLTRGAQVRILRSENGKSEIEYNGLTMEISNDNLASTPAQAIAVQTIYPRRRINLRTSKGGPLSSVSAEKGEALHVVSVSASDLDLETGEILWYQVEKDGQEYWTAGQAMEWSQENALKDYSKDLQINTLYDEQTYDGFSWEQFAAPIDFKGWAQPDFADNPRREDLKGIHITLENLIKYKDEIFAMREDGINTLVIALKGPYGQVWYDSSVLQNYFQHPASASKSSLISRGNLASLFRQLKERGFYLIGRLETFQDSLLAADNPQYAITDASGNPVSLNGSYWLSPYSRRNWQYNTDLAIELAHLGINEVQFDFCRFPDGLAADDSQNTLDTKNTYGESKTEAISNFLYFAREQLEPLHVYTAVDMYAGPVLDEYDYGIGHFYPAMLASANVVSPMAYLDSLSAMAQNQDVDVYASADAVMEDFAVQAEQGFVQTVNPASLQIWVQGWGFADSTIPGRQIAGLEEAGQSNALLWTDEGNPEVLEPILPALSSNP